MIFLLLLITGRRRRRRQRSRAAGVVQATSRPRGSSDADTAVWVWLLASGLSSPRGTCLAACCRGSGTCTTRGEGRVRGQRGKRDVCYCRERRNVLVPPSSSFCLSGGFLVASSADVRGRACGRNAAAERTGASPSCRRRAIALPCPGCGRASRRYLVWITQELSLTSHDSRPCSVRLVLAGSPGPTEPVAV